MRRGLVLGLVLSACGGDGCGEPDLLTKEEWLDPETCGNCHPTHYEQWQGSMHAYAGSDPIFIALNDKGYRETGGELGDFCVNCHSPLAVAEGFTDGEDVEDVPEHLKGVTCAFCHRVTDVEGTHNNPLKLGNGPTFYGGVKNPEHPGVHNAEYSELHDGASVGSSDMCGSCHDIVTPLGAHIERTYFEWQTSIYSDPGGVGLACGSACHMLGHDDKIADVDFDVPVRRRHDHDFAGVDVALIDWPGKDRQLDLIQSALDRTVLATLCVGENNGSTVVQVNLENVAAGHAFPSGASADRRVWVEVVARSGGAEIWSKGVIADDEVVQDAVDADPTLFTLYDTLLDSAGEPTHFFWEAADTTGDLLMPPLPGETTLANHQNRQWLVQGQIADEVEMQIHIRPMPLDLLDELVADGDLDPAVRDAMPTLSLAGANLVWTPETARDNGDVSCVP